MGGGTVVMEVWVGIATLIISVVGWALIFFWKSREEARRYGALVQKVEDLGKKVENGLSQNFRCLDRRVRNIEIKLGTEDPNEGDEGG